MVWYPIKCAPETWLTLVGHLVLK